MANEIRLDLRIDTAQSLEGIKADIKSIASSLASTPIKIKAELDNASVSEIQRQIKNITSSGATNATKVKVDVTPTTPKGTGSSGGSAINIKHWTSDTLAYDRAWKRVRNTLGQVRDAHKKWTAAASGATRDEYAQLDTLGHKFELLSNALNNPKLTKEGYQKSFAALSKLWTGLRRTIHEAGEDTSTFGHRVASLSQKFATWFGITRVIMAGVRTVKEMVNNVIELDTAMTELRKVTDETEASYNRFLNNAVTRSKTLGSSLADTVKATADFARLGYGVSDASDLADAAIVYKNVGDGIADISEASESIISTMKAFGVETSDVMSIVDKFNDVGKRLPVRAVMYA